MVVGTLSAGITLNAFSYDIARWRAGERAVAAGFPASRVDAGFEWVGMHAAGGVVNRDAFEPGWGFEAKFSDTPACVVVTDATPRQMQRYPAGQPLDRARTGAVRDLARRRAAAVRRLRDPRDRLPLTDGREARGGPATRLPTASASTPPRLGFVTGRMLRYRPCTSRGRSGAVVCAFE